MNLPYSTRGQAGEGEFLILPNSHRSSTSTGQKAGCNRHLAVKREAYFDRDLPIPDLFIFDVAASFDYLEPAKIAQAP